MSIFDFVKSKLSILDVVLEYVQVKRAGGYWKGSCPFHHETDASFTVSPDKQIFYCFGCHAGGDLIAFVAKIENLSQIEAVHHLVEKYQLSVPDEIKNEFSKAERNSSEKDLYFHTCDAAALWCHQQLLKSRHARSYLEKRNISEKEYKYFTIGYFPGGAHNTNIFLKDMARQNILVKNLIDAGIVMEGRTNLYSPFEERILFPIRDVLGRSCGFGGRVFQAQDTRAKYYNSKESLWFSKGKLLFSLDTAKKEMQYTQKAFLVEGYTDCVAMAAHGYKNTVATLGTACTESHLKLLARYIKTLYVLYDGDAAGQKAILRLTELCWEANLDLQIIKLPEKEDPASFLENGGDITKLIERSRDIFSFFVGSLGEQFWGKSLSEKMELCDKIVKVIAKISDTFKQDLLLQEAASVMQIPFESLKLLLKQHKNKIVLRNEVQEEDKEERALLNERKKQLDEIPVLEKKILGLVIMSMTSECILTVDQELKPYFSQFIQEVFKRIERYRMSKKEGKNFDMFLNSFADPVEKDWILEQSFVEEDGSPYNLLEKLLFRFRKKNWKHIVLDVKKQIFEAKQKNDKEKLQELLCSFSQLKQEMKERGLV